MRKHKRNAQGNCYEVAALLTTGLQHDDCLADLCTVFNARPVLCHGIATGAPGSKIAGQQYGHAWVEVDALVRERSNGNDMTIPRALYYRAGCIDPDKVVRYDEEQVRVMILRYKHYGPWPCVPWTKEQ